MQSFHTLPSTAASFLHEQNVKLSELSYTKEQSESLTQLGK
jgi:hypothetical protein